MEKDIIYNQDCIDFMRNSKLHIFDCIITDPPYEIDYDAKLNLRGRDYKHTELKGFKDYNLYSKLFYKVLKPNSYCIIFSGDAQFPNWKKSMEKYGFKFQQFLIWKKNNSTLSLSPYKTMINHEIINVFIKRMPKRTNTKEFSKSVLEFNIPITRYHPTQKPIELLMKIIKIYTKEGDLIYDPFAGSGSTLKASIKLNRKAIGTEKIKEYVLKSNQEIQKLKSQNQLF